MLTQTVRFLKVAAAAVVVSAAALVSAPAITTTDVAACLEDMACWDCATMGNQICGPQLAEGENAWDEGVYVGGWN